MPASEETPGSRADDPELDPEDNLSNAGNLPDRYPPLASQTNCAKNWDVSLLQICTARRLRSIGWKYDGVTSKMNKPEMFQAIWDAMLEDQDCQTCTGGSCDPTTHYFPPL